MVFGLDADEPNTTRGTGILPVIRQLTTGEPPVRRCILGFLRGSMGD
jgi:hypothetical protein